MVRPYLILAHDYRRTSAGIRVLHKLCHRLNEYGCYAYVTPSVTHPDWDTPVAGEELIRHIAAEGIVIYPEVETGNPLNARRVVRYLLNIPNRIRPATFGPDEMTWCYCGLLRRWVPGDDRILFVPVVDEEVFRPDPVIRRGDTVIYWVGKGVDSGDMATIKGALEITLNWPETAQELALLYQASDRFYSFASYTATILESRLCGCPTVVIPGLWTHEAFVAGTPGGMAGLAWGTDEGEIERARRTVGEFPAAYHALVRRFDMELDRFVHETQEYGYGN